MAVWVHLVLLPLLYLADGKPKPPGSATGRNRTDLANTTHPGGYHFDYNLFKNKSDSKVSGHRYARKVIRDNFSLEQIEVRFDWNKTLVKDRIGCLFVLRDEKRHVENAVLYPPYDESLLVRGLEAGKEYQGEVRLVRDREALEDLNRTREGDRFPFTFSSPRILTESQLSKVMDEVSSQTPSQIKLQSTAITLKLPSLREHTVLELVDINDRNDSSRLVVHMSARTASLVVNGVPSGAVLRVTLRSGEEVARSALVFTGFLREGARILSKVAPPARSDEKERQTVKCLVKDKPPFQGFPCEGSNVCIPLHWECDGEEDCAGGSDEASCEEKPPKPEKADVKCKRNEFSCTSKDVKVCLPLSWLCDGRTDCSDGWDERKENCRQTVDNVTAYTYCDRSHFKCHRGGCVLNHRACDGYKDCSDGSDEFDCPEDEEEDVEDDDNDDEDVQDDVFCDSRFEFTCDKRSRKKKCIPKPWVCDDQDDCPDGEDEEDYVCRSHYHNYFDKTLKQDERGHDE